MLLCALDSHFSVCIWLVFYMFSLLKWPHLYVASSCGLAGDSMQPLWWAVLYNAEVLGCCGGSS